MCSVCWINNTRTVQLSVEEAEYISGLAAKDHSFATLLRSHPDVHMTGRTVTLNRALAEALRDHFTERLARVGFDADSKLNREGQILEKLIDTFFIPEKAAGP